MTLQEQLGPLLPTVIAGPFPQYVNVGSRGGPAAAPDLLNRHRGAWASCGQATLHAEHQTSYDPWRACPGLAFVAPPEWRQLACSFCASAAEIGDGASCSIHGTGLKVHTLTAKKPGWLYDSRKGTHVWRDDRTVSVDVTVRLAPVVSDFDDPADDEPYPCVVVDIFGDAHYCVGPEIEDGFHITPLGDPLTPGDFVAVIERIEP